MNGKTLADRFLADVERERLARLEDAREAAAFQAKIDAGMVLEPARVHAATYRYTPRVAS